MPFTLEQRYEILTLLNKSQIESAVWQQHAEDHFYAELGAARQAKVPTFQKEDIFACLDRIEEESEFLVRQVLVTVTELNEIRQAIADERTGPDGAIKRLDVIEYEQSQRTIGMETRLEQLNNHLRYFLDLPQVPKPQTWGTLGRS